MDNKNAIREVMIKDEFITLGQLLKKIDVVSSGGEVKDYINNNKCLVNGILTTQRGKKIRNNDEVILETIGKIVIKQKKIGQLE